MFKNIAKLKTNSLSEGAGSYLYSSRADKSAAKCQLSHQSFGL